MMMEYGSQFGSSILSSETLSGTCSSRSSRIRTVRLIRPSLATLPPPGLTCRHGPNLGFSIRGGREHGTGFFVSYVELGSEAHRQGLKVGDQIVRVNGFTIDDAVHKEVLQLISNHTHLTLKVRSVGMIPVKDKKTDPLSWQIISDCGSSLRSSPPLSEKMQDVRISMIVTPRSKLGCGICKGPEWKPGIFVQFTKEGGIAREAGLRPGDQILYCNNVDFNDIPFNEAVNLMKTSHQLDLIVRKSVGSELFPGESSGYNSSASSVTGDQSPSWSDSKRLSIVKEESLDLEDRLNHLDRSGAKKWEKIEWDDSPTVEGKVYFKPTIINLSENGTIIKNNGVDDTEKNVPVTNSSKKIADICLVSQQHETKTVVVEVHRSDSEDKVANKNNLAKSSSSSSFNSLGSQTSSTSSSLANAICQEIQRRSEKTKQHQQQEQEQNKSPSIDEQLQMKKILKGIDSEKHHQHNKLMDEFRKAHRKMFNSPELNNDNLASSSFNKETREKEFTDRNSSSQTVQDKFVGSASKEALHERPSTLNNKQNVSNSTLSQTPPPPPPPLPFNGTLKKQNGNDSSTHTNTVKKKGKAPPVPVKTSTLSSFSQPPPCPTPDYDNLSISSVSTFLKPTNGHANDASQNVSDVVEMESLESFKLKNPADVRPKPPNTYFSRTKPTLTSQLSDNSGMSTLTMKKQQRPVSVTIGEYPSSTIRKQPSRFDFLQNGHDENDRSTSEPITTQLASELAQTLSRSNLRKRNESNENNEISSQYDGSVRITVNNNKRNAPIRPTNSLSSVINMESFSKALANRLTINVNNGEKKPENPNGILKNRNGNDISVHKPVVHQKSITFGEKPTVINDAVLQTS